MNKNFVQPVVVTTDHSWNDGLIAGAPITVPYNESVVGTILSLAISAPQAEAIYCEGRSYSYAHLVCWAIKIADDLNTSATAGAPVGILSPTSPGAIAAALGVMLSGRPYVPLSTQFSISRIEDILTNAQVDDILLGVNERHHLTGLSASPKCYDLNEPDAFTLPQLLSQMNEFTELSAQKLAYIIYTSGSTGKPKGVAVSHRNLAVSTAARRFVYPGEPIFLAVSPMSSDSSIAGIWGTLAAGGTVVLPIPNEVADVAGLIDLLDTKRVTHMLCVPTLYQAVLTKGSSTTGASFDSLKCVILAGEALQRDLVDKHFNLVGHSAKLVNEYGPTEATVWASFDLIEPGKEVTIGRPIPGTQFAVLDAEQNPVDVNVTGELYIGGDGVAVGYINNQSATNKVFVELKIGDGGLPTRFYRTGDLVRRAADNRLVFIGRNDQQVKVRGHRVDMLALELAVRQFLNIDEVCVVFESKNSCLCLYLVSDGGFDETKLRQEIHDRLGPIYVPSHIWTELDLQKNVAGKLDRLALGKLASERLLPSEKRQADKIPGTELVAKAWAKVLERKDLPHDHNFMDLGGHSLLVFRLQDEIEALAGTRPSAIDLFRNPTIMEQGKLIDATSSQSQSGSQISSAPRQNAFFSASYEDMEAKQ